MTTGQTTALEVKTCKCGCGANVRRNFLPGHDAKLKGRLLKATKSADWWVREPAVIAMVEQGWGHFVDGEILAQTPVRSRQGRFVRSRHIDSIKPWEGFITDAAGDTHSHRQCPEAKGTLTWSRTADGWLCSTCIHVHDYSEVVFNTRRLQTAMVAEVQVEEAEAA